MLGQCYKAISGNVYIVYREADEEGRVGIYFPFFWIRWQAGTIPIKSIEKDEKLEEIIPMDENWRMDWLDIINILGKYNNS